MPDPKDQEPGNDDFLEEEKQLDSFGLHFELTRRQFMRTAGANTAGVAAGIPGVSFAESIDTSTHQAVVLKIDGRSQSLTHDCRTSLLDALREHLDLTGSKKGCDHGQCGACCELQSIHRQCPNCRFTGQVFFNWFGSNNRVCPIWPFSRGLSLTSYSGPIDFAD